MMARIGKALLRLPGDRRPVSQEELQERVEAVEAQVDGVVTRVDDLEEREKRRMDGRDGH